MRHGRLLSLRETPFAPDAEHERPILGAADPVEPSHNLGRVLTGRTIGTVRSELQRALDHLAAGQPLGGMLAPHSAGGSVCAEVRSRVANRWGIILYLTD